MRNFLWLVMLYSSLSCAQSSTIAVSEVAEQLRDKALNSNRAWQIVESLTTEIGPRLAGTAADKKAVEWAQSLLATSGFDRVWLEPIEFPIWLRHHEKARVVTPYPQPLHITALGYSGATDGELIAPVKSFATIDELKAADSRDVQGHIVFIDQAMRRSIDVQGYADVVAVRYSSGQIAKEKGAVAVLIRSLGTDNHRLPHTGASNIHENPLPAAALSSPDADQLQRLIHLNPKLTLALDIHVSQQSQGKSWNVIAQLNGSRYPQEVVLIGAHLDSWDLGTGAIDDGAGVAITAAAAQLIGQLPQRPKRSIRLVLFANEEAGLWGAKAYAQQHADELTLHRFASESDFGAGPVWRFDSANQALVDAAKPLLASLNIEMGGAASSGGPDIKPLLEAGVPVFRLIQNGTDYFDYHHTANDTLDKIDPQDLKQNLAAWAIVTYLAAELE